MRRSYSRVSLWIPTAGVSFQRRNDNDSRGRCDCSTATNSIHRCTFINSQVKSTVRGLRPHRTKCGSRSNDWRMAGKSCSGQADTTNKGPAATSDSSWSNSGSQIKSPYVILSNNRRLIDGIIVLTLIATVVKMTPDAPLLPACVLENEG